MVQSPDFNNRINQHVYSAVKINITNPKVNAQPSEEADSGQTGMYNAVDINIDKPEVNTKPVYSYPEASSPVTYDMANINRIPLPAGFPIAYQTTNVILPKDSFNTDIEFEIEQPEREVESEEEEEPDLTVADDSEAEEEAVSNNTKEEPVPPPPSYTTVEAEKGGKEILEQNQIPVNEGEVIAEEVKATEEETAPVEIKRPEIIPSEDIMPEVDIPLVVANLTDKDFDIQAQQMEEIARVSLDNPENAVPYIVREVLTALIEISQKDSTGLPAPTNEQVNARRKVMANFIAMENSEAANETQIQLPFRLTEKEIALANEISPMEQAERNKEYALYTIAILAKVYTDEVEKHTGDIVPMTDIPGTSAMVDALRYSPNAGVKVAAIDALKYIQRPEYKEEMTTLFTLAGTDINPDVAYSAQRALMEINNSQ